MNELSTITPYARWKITSTAASPIFYSTTFFNPISAGQFSKIVFKKYEDF